VLIYWSATCFKIRVSIDVDTLIKNVVFLVKKIKDNDMINSIGSQNYAVQQTSEVKNSVVPPTAQETKSSGYVRHGWDNFIPDVEADPLFAKEMAEAVAFIPDKLMINLNDAPPLSDPAAYKNWADMSEEFDKIASKVTGQRIELFNEMKSKGSSDQEIFKELLSFNHSLPMDYQVKSGMTKVDTYA